MRRVLVVAATLVVSGTIASAAQAGVLSKSTFNTGVEGWKVVGDTQGAKEVPDYVATGGSPGGYISIADEVLGGIMYWRAPKSVCKQAADALGGSLKFSLRQQSAGTRPIDDLEDVILEGGGVTVAYETPMLPPQAPTWGKYIVPLSSSGWINTATDGPATRRDMKKVLKSLSVLTIRAEYEAGEDRDDLDTVVLKSAPKK